MERSADDYVDSIAILFEYGNRSYEGRSRDRRL